MEETTKIKTYSKKQLCIMYDISSDTLWRWITSIEDKLPHYNPNCKLLSPLQIKVFFEYFGEP
jgi:hypothetical protein